jgi:hypothetical protein
MALLLLSRRTTTGTPVAAATAFESAESLPALADIFDVVETPAQGGIGMGIAGGGGASSFFTSGGGAADTMDLSHLLLDDGHIGGVLSGGGGGGGGGPFGGGERRFGQGKWA